MKVLKRIVLPFVALWTYFRGAYNEFRHVEWPSRQAIVQYSLLVTVTIVVGALILTGYDYGLHQLTDRYLIR